MDFDYLCFWRVLIDILMNCVMNCKFSKILGNVLIKLSNHWHPRQYCVLDVYSFMISSVLCYSDVHFLFSFTLPAIVQCCPPQSEVI